VLKTCNQSEQKKSSHNGSGCSQWDKPCRTVAQVWVAFIAATRQRTLTAWVARFQEVTTASGVSGTVRTGYASQRYSLRAAGTTRSRCDTRDNTRSWSNQFITTAVVNRIGALTDVAGQCADHRQRVWVAQARVAGARWRDASRRAGYCNRCRLTFSRVAIAPFAPNATEVLHAAQLDAVLVPEPATRHEPLLSAPESWSDEQL